MCKKATNSKSLESKVKVLSNYEASTVLGGIYECYRCGAAYISKHNCPKDIEDDIMNGIN